MPDAHVDAPLEVFTSEPAPMQVLITVVTQPNPTVSIDWFNETDHIMLVTTRTFSILSDVLRNFFKSRNFLGLQLNHAWGNIDDDTFEEQAQEYLKVRNYSSSDLQLQISMLIGHTPNIPWDADTLAVAFDCDIKDVEDAVEGIGQQLLLFSEQQK